MVVVVEGTCALCGFEGLVRHTGRRWFCERCFNEVFKDEEVDPWQPNQSPRSAKSPQDADEASKPAPEQERGHASELSTVATSSPISPSGSAACG